MTPYQQMDYIIDKCKSFGLKHVIQKELGVNDQRMDQLINRIINDGYIERYKNNSFAESYTLTFEGEMFEGYENKSNRLSYENTRLETIEKKQMANQIAMTWLTTILSIGALPIAYQALIYIWEYYLPYQYIRIYELHLLKYIHF